jgi:hypothetical protein
VPTDRKRAAMLIARCQGNYSVISLSACEGLVKNRLASSASLNNIHGDMIAYCDALRIKAKAKQFG